MFIKEVLKEHYSPILLALGITLVIILLYLLSIYYLGTPWEFSLRNNIFILAASFLIFALLYITLYYCIHILNAEKHHLTEQQLIDAEHKLIAANEELEEKVRERTSELEELFSNIQIQETYVRTILDHILDGILAISSSQGIITTYNQAAEKIFGYEASEVIGNNISMLIPELYEDDTHNFLHKLLGKSEEEEEGIEEEMLGKHKEGYSFPITIGLTQMESFEAKIFICIVRDITEQKRHEEAIRNHQENLRALVEEKTADLNSTNIQLQKEKSLVELLQKTALAANEAETIEQAMQTAIDSICEFTGWPVGHAYMFDEDKNELYPTVIWHIEDTKAFHQFMLITGNTRCKPNEELPGIVYNSRKPVWIKNISEFSLFSRAASTQTNIVSGIALPVLIKDHVHAVLEFFDVVEHAPNIELMEIMSNIGTQLGRIIERKQSADALRYATMVAENARKEAEHANKLKTDFLANMSHELRTPMHAILTYSRFGIEKIHRVNDEKIISYFTTIRDSGTRLIQLLNDLLDLSKLESGKMNFSFSRENLSEVIKHAIKEANILASEKKLTIQTEGLEDISLIEIDSQRITQVIINLLGNAIKFTPEHKTITVFAEPVELPNKKEGVVISIRDQGIGIPKEELGTIFDKFIQSSKTNTGAGGTGLGLSICREIIHAHHGTIWAENDDEEGAIFRFTLPFSQTIEHNSSNEINGENHESTDH